MHIPSKVLLGVAIILSVLGAACQRGATPVKNPVTNSTNSQVTALFPAGIYYRQINVNEPSGVLTHIGSPLAPFINMTPVDFDMQLRQAVYANNDTLYMVTPGGSQRSVKVKGIYQMVRPTLSPDGQKVAVQATRTFHAEGESGSPNELKIFVIDVTTGEATQISRESTTPNESPTWFNASNKIAYSTFSPTEGIDIQIYDLDQERITMTLENAGFLHLAISADDTRLLVPATMSVYDLTTGKKVDEIKNAVTQGIRKAGFTPEAQELNNAGTFFSDGDWSPDGTQIVFDAIVSYNGDPHIVMFTMNADGSDVKAVTEPIEVNPDFSNGLNYSQVNPVWI